MRIKTLVVACTLVTLVSANAVYADISNDSAASSETLASSLALVGIGSLAVVSVAATVPVIPIAIVGLSAEKVVDSYDRCQRCQEKLPVADEIIILEPAEHDGL